MPRPRTIAALVALACSACARAPSATIEPLAALPQEPAPAAAAVIEPVAEPEPEPEPEPVLPDLLETLTAIGEHAQWRAAIERAGLAERLQGGSPTTILAPSDTALAGLSRRDRQRLDKPAEAAPIVRRHVLTGVHRLAELEAGAEVRTIDGEALTVGRDGDAVTIGGVRVSAEHEARDGVVLSIASLLPPKSARPKK